jgi:hypothetical protein
MACDRDGYEKLYAWESKILRRMYGPMVEQGIWRIRTDQGLWELL